MPEDVAQEVRQVLAQHGHLPTDPQSLAIDADLYAAGMTSHASVGVMIALEDHFDIEFPDALLTRSVFSSISAIMRAVETLHRESAVS